MRMRNNEHRKAGVKKGRAPEESSNNIILGCLRSFRSARSLAARDDEQYKHPSRYKNKEHKTMIWIGEN